MGRPTVLFLGSLDYQPNQDAIHYFRSEIWPLIQRQAPATRWLIAGRSSTQDLRALAAPNIEVAGWVADARDPLHSSDVMVVPLRSGSGTRLKILESWAAGLPVVSTSIGAEGLDVSDGENIVLADDPCQFAEAVLKVLRNPELSRRLADNGRQLVEERYDWRAIAPRLDRAFAGVLAAGGQD
jgi:glycosyltransferase involved in cell wall biosynthesis